MSLRLSDFLSQCLSFHLLFWRNIFFHFSMLLVDATEIIIALIEFFFYLIVPEFVDTVSVSCSLHCVDTYDKSTVLLFFMHYYFFEAIDCWLVLWSCIMILWHRQCVNQSANVLKIVEKINSHVLCIVLMLMINRQSYYLLCIMMVLKCYVRNKLFYVNVWPREVSTPRYIFLIQACILTPVV